MMNTSRRPISNTCIAVVKDKKGKLVMASDRRVSWGFSQAQAMPGPKCFHRNGVLLAGTGDAYLCMLIAKHMPFPKKSEEDDLESYVYDGLYEYIKRMLLSKGFTQDDKNVHIPVNMSAEVLIGVGGRLFSAIIENPSKENELQGMISMDEVALPYATGCGGQLAWGSLLTTDGTKMSAEDRLQIALTVAATVSPGCDANVDMVKEL